MGEPSLSPDETVPLGSVLDGRYRIDAVLGAGGMGCVYRGEHTSLGRIVAIKVLHADLGRNKEAAARFQREALASGRLDHPNIIGVSDFGVLDDGALYLVMEALEGESVRDRLERDHRIPWPLAVHIIRSVMTGLHHAHERGVVHRDIKPDNIFLAKRDGDQIVKILDFGIAKLYAGSSDDPATTRAGLTVGTPAYLSPEQAVGGAITPASDIYSTTVVLYEMLAGRGPYQDKDPLSMLTAHVTREAPTFAQIAPDLQLPPGLESLVRRGLQKVAKHRIATAAEYMQLLDDVLRNPGAELATHPQPSGPLVIQTPLPDSSRSPFPTPRPFAHESLGVAPTASALPALDPPMTHTVSSAHRTPTLAEISEPIPRTWIKFAALFLIVASAAALYLLANRSTAAPSNGFVPVALTLDRETRLKALLHDLETGKTCADRKAVIPKLVELGDEAAISELDKARYRMRGGVLGLGETNSNACLKPDAELAIKALGQ